VDAARAALLAGLHAPRFEAPVELDANLALLPADAKCKGMYQRDILDRVARTRPAIDLWERAGVQPRKYRSFLDYSYHDLLRLTYASAEVLWPDLPRGEGLRRLGHTAYDVLTRTQIGRVIFGVFGRDFGRIAPIGAKGWNVSLNFGRVEFVRLAERRGAYFFEGMACFLETYQTGVVEGAMSSTGTRGTVRCNIETLDRGVIEFEWE
jgi:uncharacterized protein (TIGR02265 family)